MLIFHPHLWVVPKICVSCHIPPSIPPVMAAQPYWTDYDEGVAALERHDAVTAEVCFERAAAEVPEEDRERFRFDVDAKRAALYIKNGEPDRAEKMLAPYVTAGTDNNYQLAYAQALLDAQRDKIADPKQQFLRDERLSGRDYHREIDKVLAPLLESRDEAVRAGIYRDTYALRFDHFLTNRWRLGLTGERADISDGNNWWALGMDTSLDVGGRHNYRDQLLASYCYSYYDEPADACNEPNIRFVYQKTPVGPLLQLWGYKAMPPLTTMGSLLFLQIFQKRNII